MNDNKNIRYKNIIYCFDKVTSNHGSDWFLALTWIFIFEIISSIIEYEYLTVAKSYIINIPDGILKEFLIAIFVTLFVWYIVLSIINMRKNQFYFLVLYAVLGIYFFITKDMTFNLFFHNIINPFEFEFNGFGLYTIIQFFLKFIIIYILFKMLRGLKKSK